MSVVRRERACGAARVVVASNAGHIHKSSGMQVMMIDAKYLSRSDSGMPGQPQRLDPASSQLVIVLYVIVERVFVCCKAGLVCMVKDIKQALAPPPRASY